MSRLAQALLQTMEAASSPPEFIDSRNGGYSSGGVSFTKPGSVADGDVLVAAIICDSSVTFTTPSGWTLLRNDVVGSYRLRIFTRTGAAADSSPYLFSHSGTFPSRIGVMVVYRGAAAPPNVHGSTNGASATATAPSVDTTVANCLVLSIHSVGNAGPVTLSTPAGTTLRVQEEFGPSIQIADAVQVSAGASGAKTSTMSASTTWRGATVALAPA